MLLVVNVCCTLACTAASDQLVIVINVIQLSILIYNDVVVSLVVKATCRSQVCMHRLHGVDARFEAVDAMRPAASAACIPTVYLV